jgi:RHS repeat-associated protein
MSWSKPILPYSLSTGYQYTGQYHDSYIKLYWYNSRWYDPYLARFNQPDTIIPNQYDPNSWDRYLYVAANPLRYVDPSGFCNEDPYDPYYDYECFTLAQDISEQYGLPYDSLEKHDYDVLVKLNGTLNVFNNVMMAVGQAPLNFSLESIEITLHKDPYFEFLVGIRAYYQARVETINSEGAITIGPDQTDIGPLSIGPTTMDYTITESWIDQTSTSLNLGLPDTPFDPQTVDLSVDISHQSGPYQATNTLGVEAKIHPDNLALVAIAYVIFHYPYLYPVLDNTLRRVPTP